MVRGSDALEESNDRYPVPRRSIHTRLQSASRRLFWGELAMVALGTLVAETRLIPIGRTPMRVLAVGLLSIIALGSGNLTGSANELRYNPPAKIFLAECDQSAMQICRQMWNYCSDICRSDSDPDHQQTCWTGCVNRYNHCTIAADCR
jgi:hypothetical protein